MASIFLIHRLAIIIQLLSFRRLSNSAQRLLLSVYLSRRHLFRFLTRFLGLEASSRSALTIKILVFTPYNSSIFFINWRKSVEEPVCVAFSITLPKKGLPNRNLKLFFHIIYMSLSFLVGGYFKMKLFLLEKNSEEGTGNHKGTATMYIYNIFSGVLRIIFMVLTVYSRDSLLSFFSESHGNDCHLQAKIQVLSKLLSSILSDFSLI